MPKMRHTVALHHPICEVFVAAEIVLFSDAHRHARYCGPRSGARYFPDQVMAPHATANAPMAPIPSTAGH